MPVDRQATRRYFSELARGGGAPARDNADKFDVVGSLLAPPHSHPRVLECGGGSGFYTLRLLEQGYRVVCVDVSDEALRANRTRAAQTAWASALTTVAADFLDYCRTQPAQVDQVVFIKTLHHFESEAAVHAALEQGAGLCRPGGRLALFEPNGANALWWLLLHLQRDRVTHRPKWSHERNMRFTTPGRLNRFLQGSPAIRERQTAYRCARHFVVPGMLLARLNRSEHWLRRLDRRLSNHRWAGRWGLNFSIVIDF